MNYRNNYNYLCIPCFKYVTWKIETFVLVWNFYKEPFRDKEGEIIAECKLCLNVYTECSGNTSNEKTHLVRYHIKAYKKALKERALTIGNSKAEDELIDSSMGESNSDVLDTANTAAASDMFVINKEKGDGDGEIV